MAHITITGNVGGVKDLQTSQSGKSFIKFSVAWSESSKNREGQWVDGPTSWVQCTAFNKLAEGIANTLQKGQQVVVSGNLKPEEWQGQNGSDTVLAMTVDACGPSLVFQDAQVSKRQHGGQGGNFGGQQQGGFNNQQQQPQQPQGGFNNDPWNSAPPAGGFNNSDDVPF